MLVMEYMAVRGAIVILGLWSSVIGYSAVRRLPGGLDPMLCQGGHGYEPLTSTQSAGRTVSILRQVVRCIWKSMCWPARLPQEHRASIMPCHCAGAWPTTRKHQDGAVSNPVARRAAISVTARCTAARAWQRRGAPAQLVAARPQRRAGRRARPAPSCTLEHVVLPQWRSLSESLSLRMTFERTWPSLVCQAGQAFPACLS